MTASNDFGELHAGREAHRGRTFVYVLASQGEDLTKIGFTHDPVQRRRRFHPRFFDLFDLQKSLLVETMRLRDARKVERLVIERWPDHRASAPLLVSEAAGGHTEWFRGIGDEMAAMVREVAERYDYAVHAPLRDWLRRRFVERADHLYEWSARMLTMIQWQQLHGAPEAGDPRYGKVLRDTFDACNAAGMMLDDLVPADVMRWYREQGI